MEVHVSSRFQVVQVDAGRGHLFARVHVPAVDFRVGSFLSVCKGELTGQVSKVQFFKFSPDVKTNVPHGEIVDLRFWLKLKAPL